MKKILNNILIISLLILFCGCDSYNLDGFILPDDPEFLEVIRSLDTPKKISDYMGDNFTYKVNHTPASPYKIWEIGEGDCNDFVCFAKYVGNYNGIVVYEIIINDGSIFSHSICVYEEYSPYGIYSFTSVQDYYSGYKTFRETVIRGTSTVNMNWKNYKVYNYDGEIIEKGVK